MEKTPRVLLLSLPWTSLVEPSLGLGILKAELQKNNIQCRVKHLNLLLLKYMRATTYVSIANMFAVNEFLFTYPFEQELSKKQLSELSLRIDEALSNNIFNGDDRYNTRKSIGELFLKIRNKIIPSYLLDCLSIIEDYKPTMVGFTCMFDQTFPSVALAKLVKEKFPEITIVFGGYALEDSPGKQIIESFDFIDCVSYGEGEKVIVDLALGSVGKKDFNEIPDLLYRKRNSKEVFRSNTSKSQINLNESPAPNYDDFQLDINQLKQDFNIEVKWTTIPIETSRGCWWGQKKHCVFCGIDDITMRYRQRDVENTLNILQELKTKYDSPFFRISDYILPYNYYKTLLPILGNYKEEDKYVFTCEIKANITDEQFKMLAKAGFIEVQPGIESFSTRALKKMDKGVTAIQNIYCLILGLLNSVQVNYNILYGFPNDEVEDYFEMLRIIPLLYHLNPPSSRVKVVITRFAPLHTDPKRFNFPSNYKHHPGYNVLFSPNYLEKINFNLSNYCYYFDYPYKSSPELENLHRALTFQVDYWRTIHQKRDVTLTYEIISDKIIFEDTRFNEVPEVRSYSRNYALVYKECAGSLINIDVLAEKLHFLSFDVVYSIIDELVKDRFIIREGNKVLGLALTSNVYESIKNESKKWAKPYV